MKVAVTGSSGLIGTALVPALRGDGHTVVRVVRRPPQAAYEVTWDPAARQLDPAALADADAVVHLAGVGVADRRWTAAHKAEVIGSRVDGTTTVSEALAAAPARDRVLLSASAVGYYGDTGDRTVDETAQPGQGFLADTCVQWERCTVAAEQAGVRVVHLRTGVVQSGSGGALKSQLPLFKLGLGGRLGSGRQYVSWISLPDEVAAIRFLLSAGDVRGPVNLTGPEPVSNADFTATLGRVLSRPTALPVPGAVLKLALDGFATEGVLAGQRVLPRVLEEAGFRFAHPDLESALRAVV